MKHDHPYGLDDLISDIDATSAPDSRLQVIKDLSSDYNYPADILDDLDKRSTKKEISEIQTQLKMFNKKKNLKVDSPYVSPNKNREQEEPI